MVLQSRRDFDLFLKVLTYITAFAHFINVCNGGELSESESFFNFIRTVDPKNILRIDWNGLVPHPCSYQWKGVVCDLHSTNIVEIRLDNLNLSGMIDTDSLCKLPNLQVLSLARNRIQGNIPDSIKNCARLTYLNLSSNLLNGSIPISLTKLKNLRRLDISKNHSTGTAQHFKQAPRLFNKDSMGPSTVEAEGSPSASSPPPDSPSSHAFKNWIACLPLVVGIAFFLLFTLFVNMRTSKLAKDKMILRALAHSPPKIPPPNVEEVLKPEQKLSELVFFVEEEERFGLEDLLEAAADLQNQGFCSSLYKVKLKNNDAIFAVKRLKKLKVTSEEFGQTMQKIGNFKHQNILPPVGYNSCNEEMLLIYRYQGNGSLLTLLENYTESKRDFPWKLRLSIAIGIARGLDFIYQSSDDWEIIPHGNIKPSNILLNENEEPLISDYGYSKFLDPNKRVFNSNGYTAPEGSLSEQADVFSFGVILLELLTGKIVQKSGLDLPKWVKSVVREEWTGEVFDKEVAKVGRWAFPLLNISLKCVAHFPENRPTFAEVLEKIEEVVNGQEDLSPLSKTLSEAN